MPERKCPKCMVRMTSKSVGSKGGVYTANLTHTCPLCCAIYDDRMPRLSVSKSERMLEDSRECLRISGRQKWT